MRKKSAPVAPRKTDAAAPIAREGGSWIVDKDGGLLREVPRHENGGGRALTPDEQKAAEKASVAAKRSAQPESES